MKSLNLNLSTLFKYMSLKLQPNPAAKRNRYSAPLMSNVMPHMCSRLIVASCILVAAVGCTARDSTSSAIAKQFTESKGSSINLTAAGPGAWEKVCVLGPYSNNDTVEQTLGFKWDAETKTSIQTNESISLLLFVQEKRIVSYVEHPRNNGDFSNLTMQCFPREKAQFIHDPNPIKGWPGLFPKNVE